MTAEALREKLTKLLPAVELVGDLSLRVLLTALDISTGFAIGLLPIVWIHYLTLWLGHLVTVQDTVMSFGMLSMALAAWWSRRWREQNENQFYIYMAGLALLGGCSWLFHPAFLVFSRILYNGVIPHVSSPLFVDLMQLFFTGILVLPQGFLIGLVIVAAGQGLISHYPERPGAVLGRFYFAITLGVGLGLIVGAAVSTHYLGIFGSLQFAALTCVVTSVGALVLLFPVIQITKLKREREATRAEMEEEEAVRGGGMAALTDDEEDDDQAQEEQKPQRLEEQPLPYQRYVAITGLFISGILMALFIEIWVSFLDIILKTAVYSFAFAFGTLLLGTSITSYEMRTRVEDMPSIKDIFRAVSYRWLFAAVFMVLVYWQFSFLHVGFEHFIRSELESGYGLRMLALLGLGTVVAVLFPVAYSAGSAFLLWGNIYHRTVDRSGFVSESLQWHWLGWGITSYLIAHLAAAIFGWYGLLLLTTLLLVAVAIGVVFYSQNWRCWRWLGSAIAASVLVLLGLLLSPTQFQVDPQQQDSGAVHFQQSERLLSTLVLALQQKPGNVLLIGTDSGALTNGLLADESVRHIHTVVYDSQLREHFLQQSAPLQKQYPRRYQVSFDKVRSVLAKQNANNGLIIALTQRDIDSGFVSQYTWQFYQLVARGLRDDGLFIQRLRLAKFNWSALASVMDAVAQVFPYYELYRLDEHTVLLVASLRDQPLAFSNRIFQQPRLRKIAHKFGLYAKADLALYRLGSSVVFKAYFNSITDRVNTDFVLLTRYHPLPLLPISPVPDQLVKVADYLPLGLLDPAELGYQCWYRACEHKKLPRADLARQTHAVYQFITNYRYQGSDPDQIIQGIDLQHTQGATWQGWNLASRCNSLAEIQQYVDGMLNNLAPAALAWQPDKMRNIINAFVRLPAYRLYPIQHWLGVYLAITERDSQKMLLHANWLLERHDELTERQRMYLLGLTMLGYLVQDDREAAQKVYIDNKAFIDQQREHWSIDFKIVWALINE